MLYKGRAANILSLGLKSLRQPLKPLKQELVILAFPAFFDPESQFCPNQYGSTADKILHGVHGHYPLMNQDTDRFELETDTKGSGYIFIAEGAKLLRCETIVQLSNQSVSFSKFAILERPCKFQYRRAPNLFSMLIELYQSECDTENDRQGSENLNKVC